MRFIISSRFTSPAAQNKRCFKTRDKSLTSLSIQLHEMYRWLTSSLFQSMHIITFVSRPLVSTRARKIRMHGKEKESRKINLDKEISTYTYTYTFS